MVQKQSVRARMLNQRRHLSAENCFALSLKAQQQLLGADEFIRARSIALYSPIMNEVFTELILAASLQEGKEVAFPRIAGDSLEFVRVRNHDELVPGAFGVLEPQGSEIVQPAHLDLVLVPGVAFSRDGARLGYGKGFYDRALQGVLSEKIVGFCYGFQLLDSLPSESHDCRMQSIVTEGFILTCAMPEV